MKASLRPAGVANQAVTSTQEDRWPTDRQTRISARDTTCWLQHSSLFDNLGGDGPGGHQRDYKGLEDGALFAFFGRKACKSKELVERHDLVAL